MRRILLQNLIFLLSLNTWAISDIENAASKLLKVYASDLDSDFPSEVVIFEKNCLIETIPNVAIILRTYLTLPVANTKGERSFSALKSEQLPALISDGRLRL